MKSEKVVPIIAALLQLILCLAIKSMHYEGSWGGLFMFFLGLPFSIPSLFIARYFGGREWWEVIFITINSMSWWGAMKLFYFFKEKKLEKYELLYSDKSLEDFKSPENRKVN